MQKFTITITRYTVTRFGVVAESRELALQNYLKEGGEEDEKRRFETVEYSVSPERSSLTDPKT